MNFFERMKIIITFSKINWDNKTTLKLRLDFMVTWMDMESKKDAYQDPTNANAEFSICNVQSIWQSESMKDIMIIPSTFERKVYR